MFTCFGIQSLQKDGQVLNANIHIKHESRQNQQQEFRQNSQKINIPPSIVRSSSIPKILSCKNVKTQISEMNTIKNHSSQRNSQILKDKNLIFQTNSSQDKQKKSNDLKSTIFNKLIQKNKLSTRNTQINDKENHNQKQQLQIPSENFYHKHQNMNKLMNILKQKTQKELKQCTFNPRINISNQKLTNNPKEFYKQQIQYHKKTQDKIEQIKLLIEAQKQKQNTFKPKISQETALLTQRRTQMNVYDRLYTKDQEKCETLRQNSFQNTKQEIKRSSSKKSISIVSNKKYGQNSQEKGQSTKSMKKFGDIFPDRSKQLLKTNTKSPSFQNLHNYKQNFNYQHQQNPSNKINSINLNKGTFQKYQDMHFLDCRQLLKQKQRSNNFLSKEQSCKLINQKTSKQDHIKSNTPSHNQSKQKSYSKSKISQINEKITLQKFVREFFKVISKTGIKSRINFFEMLQLMKKMNFLQNLQQFKQEKTTPHTIKTSQIWFLLEGNQNNSVLSLNLLRVFCSLLGYHDHSLIQQTIKTVGKFFPEFEQLLRCGKSLILSEKDSKAIKKDFQIFYLIRFKLGESKLTARDSNIQQYIFRPSVSQQSQLYAQKYRQRIIFQSQNLISQGLIDFQVPQSGEIDHLTFLLLDQQVKNYKIKKLREQKEDERKKQEDQSMIQHSSFTHQSSINQTSQSINQHKISIRQEELNSNMFSRISHNQSQSRSKDQILADLYQNSLRNKSLRRDKSADEIQFQKVKDQLTFMPQINKKIIEKMSQNNGLHQNIPNFAKQVMRMRSRNQTKQHMSLSPVLYLNVTMEGNNNVRIPVYENQNFQSLTEKVRVLMGIQDGEEQKSKLTNILKHQIIPALNELGIQSVNGSFIEKQLELKDLIR